MIRKLNFIFIVVLFLFFIPSLSSEISEHKEYLSSKVEEIPEELDDLNSNLNSLSLTLLNLLPKNSIE